MGKPNILLIIMDSVRASNSSIYGYESKTTPYLEKFHNEHGTLFEKAWSPSTWSLPSHASIFSGYHVKEHGVVNHTDRLKPENNIFDTLRKKGYKTGVFTNNPWISRIDVGLKDSFDYVEPANKLLYFEEGLNPHEFVNGGNRDYISYLKSSISHRNTLKSLLNGLIEKGSRDHPKITPDRFDVQPSADKFVSAFERWINKNSQDSPWAACINFMDAHHPYKPDEEFDKWADKEVRNIQDQLDDGIWEFYSDTKWWKREILESLYDGCILQTDSAIQDIVQILKNKGMFDNTYIVATSDHGEGFGEYNDVVDHKASAHNSSITESMLRVPLIIKEPGQKNSRTINHLSTPLGFRNSVEELLKSNEEVHRSFVSDRIISYHPGMSVLMRQTAESRIENIERYDKKGHSIYERTEEGVAKYMRWGEKTGVCLIPNNTESNSGIIESTQMFDESNDMSAIDDQIQKSDSDISEEVKDRLDDLGYI